MEQYSNNQVRDKETLHDTSICQVSKEIPRTIDCVCSKDCHGYSTNDNISSTFYLRTRFITQKFSPHLMPYCPHKVISYNRYWLFCRSVNDTTKGTHMVSNHGVIQVVHQDQSFHQDVEQKNKVASNPMVFNKGFCSQHSSFTP